MPDARSVIVYGASGYTGKLIAEFLAVYGIPFTAAGRNADTLSRAMRDVPGLDESGYSVCEVAHDADALRSVFAAASVVINVVGPFGQLGQPVVEAALREGCHYLDTTGEQDWVLRLRDEFGDEFARRERVLCPACSWMWVGGLLVAEECLAEPGIDSVNILYAPRGAATIASTLSFMRMINKEQLRLIDNELSPWPLNTLLKVAAPHTHEILSAFPWSGGCEPIWFHRDSRVRNCSVAVAFPNEPGVDWLVDYMKQYQEAAKTKSSDELEDLTNSWGMSWASTPAREILDVNRCVVSCKARGTLKGMTRTHYATSPYLQTGVLQAEATRQLLAGRHHQVGFVSPASAFGAGNLRAALAREGLQADSD